MFVDHSLWPPPAPSEPPPPPSGRRMTEREEKRLGWGLFAVSVVLFAGPLAGSSVASAVTAAAASLYHALAG